MLLEKIMRILYLFTIILGITSCKNNTNSIDISTVEYQQSVFRFDEWLAENEPLSNEEWLKISDNNPAFAEMFSQQLLGTEVTTALPELQKFKRYFDSTGVSNLIQTHFNTLTEVDEFEKVQKKLMVLFEDYKPSDIVTMNSGFNYKNVLLDGEIALGLEYYLYPEIDYLQIGRLFSEYQMHRFTKEYITVDLTSSVIKDLYPDIGEYNTFLKRIIYEGKLLYLKQILLPMTPPEVIMGVSSTQYDWLKQNEREIWQYFVSEELLYNNDLQRWKTYVFDGPFSAGMPEEAPAQTGNYIGWQIIKAYLHQHNEVSIQELFDNDDARQIFSESKYRP